MLQLKASNLWADSLEKIPPNTKAWAKHCYVCCSFKTRVSQCPALETEPFEKPVNGKFQYISDICYDWLIIDQFEHFCLPNYLNETYLLEIPPNILGKLLNNLHVHSSLLSIIIINNIIVVSEVVMEIMKIWRLLWKWTLKFFIWHENINTWLDIRLWFWCSNVIK